ncbi:alpha/beta fold hydrolase [Fischerella thermalis]|jgi:pimeloyl-ACP methyl ester carboxylesterase|uniref:Alpha/beta hydrolase fold protein n=1 Tax=Fischerella thermalis JSC-11 TaxID=741277 RepID=G6FUG2_9CYAN
MTPKVSLKPCFLTTKRLQPEYPLFVYLPGMDGTGQLLRTQTAGLEVGFDVRCLAIPREDLTSWEVLTNNVLDLIHAELEKSSQRPVYLCGESFGGCLAQKVAVAAPHLFARIILINPASSFHLRPLYEWASQFSYLVPSSCFDIGALALLPFLATLSRISRSDRQELLKTMRSIPSQTVLWRLSLIREFSVDEQQLRQLNQPVLLVASTQDRLLPSLAEAQRLANILPNSKVVVLPESGHACLLETDINLYEIMKANDFLESGAKAAEAMQVGG